VTIRQYQSMKSKDSHSNNVTSLERNVSSVIKEDAKTKLPCLFY